MSKQGFSLIETVLYIGLLAIVLSVFASALLRMTLQYQSIDPRVRMEQRAAIVFDQLSYDVSDAASIDTTNSSLGSHPSRLEIVNDAGQSIRVEVVEDTVAFVGGDESVDRLRYRVGSDDVVWMTDPDMEVTEWVVEAVRDSAGTLTGLNIHLSIEMREATGVYRGTSFEEDLTLSLQAPTTEI